MGKTDQDKNEMKVFCIGLSRTGTTSLCFALNNLGIPTKHFLPELFVNPSVINPKLSYTPQIRLNFYWNKMRNAEINALSSRDVDNILNKYTGFGDLPIPLYYKELDRKYPQSKFIYTYRSSEGWLKSMKWLLTDAQVLWKSGFINEEIRLAIYGTRFYDADKLNYAFRKHHTDVMEYFKDRSSDILILNLDDKKMCYSDICQFLCLPETNNAFPIVNKPIKVSMEKKIDYWLGKNCIPYSLVKKVFSRALKSL